MPRYVGRAAVTAVAAALLLSTTGNTRALLPLAQPTSDESTQDIERVHEIERVLQLRRVDALAAEAAAAAAAAQAVNASSAGLVATPVAAGASGIPATVLAAYRRAEANLAQSDPFCRLPWWLLAGIGRIESGHASGGRVDNMGTTKGNILGPRLDGSLAGTAVISDSDGGALDGDPAFDRAVGPMQFLPATWRTFARDGNGDRTANPHNVFDAATTAGVYLCRSGGDLSVPANLARAVFAYNPSQSYVSSVLSWGAAYRDGATQVTDSAGTVPATVPRQPAVPAPKAPPPNRPPVLAAGPVAPAPPPPAAPAPPPVLAAAPPAGSAPAGPAPALVSNAPTSPPSAPPESTPSPTSPDSTPPPTPPATSDQSVVVPPVVGLSVEAARQALATAGLVADVPTADSAEVEGKATQQSPSADTPVDRGSKVQLTVSFGEHPPSTGQTTGTLTGASAATPSTGTPTKGPTSTEAAPADTPTTTPSTTKEALSTSARTTAPPTSSAPPTTATSIAAPSPSASKATPAETELPAVVGQLMEAALAELKKAGFAKVTVIPVHDPSQPEGSVVSTEPGGGQVLPVNTAITVKVASGKVKVPDLVGLNTSAAALRAAGLQLKYDTERVESATVPEGQVVSQEKAPDTLVRTGTVVKVKLAVKPSAPAAGQSTTSPAAVPSRESGKAKKDGASAHK